MFWSAKASRCLAVSTLPATEASAVSANCVVQRGQRLLRRFQPRGQVDHLLGHRIQPGRRVDDQIPQLRERFPLGVELAVGLGRRHDDPGQQVAPLRGRLGDGVVEDLADVERLRQRRLRVGRPRG